MHIQNPKDLAAGALYLLIGLGALLFVGEGEVGSLAGMGPLYFPRIVAACLMIVGAVICLKSFGRGQRTTVKAARLPRVGLIPALAAPLCVFASALFFGLTLLDLGFIAAAAGAVLISCFAHPESRIRESIALAVFLTVLTAGLFVFGMGLPVSLLPPALDLI